MENVEIKQKLLCSLHNSGYKKELFKTYRHCSTNIVALKRAVVLSKLAVKKRNSIKA